MTHEPHCLHPTLCLWSLWLLARLLTPDCSRGVAEQSLWIENKWQVNRLSRTPPTSFWASSTHTDLSYNSICFWCVPVDHIQTWHLTCAWPNRSLLLEHFLSLISRCALFHFIWFVNSTRVLKEMFDCHSFAVLGCEVWNCWTQVPSHNHYVCLLMQTMRAAVSKRFIIFLVFHKQNIILLMVLLTVKIQEVLISRVVAMWPVLTPKAKGYRNKDKDLCGRNDSFPKLWHSWHHIPDLHWRCHQFLVFIQSDMQYTYYSSYC